MSEETPLRADRAEKLGSAEGDGIVRCDACPVLCRIRPGRAGACSRYANDNGRLVRTDPVLLMQRALDKKNRIVPFARRNEAFDPSLTFLTGVGAGTTYPDYKPAPTPVRKVSDGSNSSLRRANGTMRSFCSRARCITSTGSVRTSRPLSLA